MLMPARTKFRRVRKGEYAVLPPSVTTSLLANTGFKLMGKQEFRPVRLKLPVRL